MHRVGIFFVFSCAMIALGWACDGSCDDHSYDAGKFDAYFRAAEQVTDKIDQEVGTGCITYKKFTDCTEGVCADVQALSGCKTADDLKHTLYTVRDYVRDPNRNCRNYRLVIHDGTVASRIRSME